MLKTLKITLAATVVVGVGAVAYLYHENSKVEQSKHVQALVANGKEVPVVHEGAQPATGTASSAVVEPVAHDMKDALAPSSTEVDKK